MPIENETKLLTQAEFLEELNKIGLKITGRMLRNYVSEDLLPPPRRIPGHGNVGYFEKPWVNRVVYIHELVKEGERLESIKSIFASADASEGEIVDFVTSFQYVDIRKYILKQLKEGKKLNHLKKQSIMKSKERFLAEYTKHHDPKKYKRMTDDFFRLLSKYRNLFPEGWKKDDILRYFGFTPGSINFNDRKAVRVFKINFFKKLSQFLKGKQTELQEDIDFCEESIKGLKEIIKDMK